MCVSGSARTLVGRRVEGGREGGGGEGERERERERGRENVSVVVVQLLNHMRLFLTPRTAAHQAPLSFSISRSLFKFLSIELVMLSNHLILFRPLLLPSIFPSIRVFSNELVLHIRWPEYWSFRFSIRFSLTFRVDFF